MEISAEKTKLMTNSVNDILKEIKAKGQKHGTVISFRYPEQLFQMNARNGRFSKELHKYCS